MKMQVSCQLTSSLVEDVFVALVGSWSPEVRDNLSIFESQAAQSVLYCLTLEDGTHRLSRNFGDELPPNAK